MITMTNICTFQGLSLNHKAQLIKLRSTSLVRGFLPEHPKDIPVAVQKYQKTWCNNMSNSTWFKRIKLALVESDVWEKLLAVVEAHWNYDLKGMKIPAEAVPRNQRKDIQIGGLETVVTRPAQVRSHSSCTSTWCWRHPRPSLSSSRRSPQR